MSNERSPVSKEALQRLAGQWGGYDFRVIRDKHFATADELVERFLESNAAWWSRSPYAPDQELNSKVGHVRVILREWAERKLERMSSVKSIDTLTAHIMFKQLHYGRGMTINFGSTGINWWNKQRIAEDLNRLIPWSVEHAASVFGSTDALHAAMTKVVAKSNSPTESRLYEAWRDLSPSHVRPMLFPQVMGHTSGKFWDEGGRPIHFDFGLINVAKQAKILIECDSRRYHSDDPAYTNDRVRQNVAVSNGWRVYRFTYHHVMDEIEYVWRSVEGLLEY